MRHYAAFFVTLLACGTLAAAIFGGAPYELLEKKACGYHLIGNALIDDQVTLFNETTNRQGDTCIERSTATLKKNSFFNEATVAKAYLIWMGAVDPAKFAAPTDNMVHLSFTRADGYTKEADIIAGDTARYLGDTSDPFLFESLRFTADVATGCSDTAAGTPTTAEIAYFTYRVDVTDFFTAITADNKGAAVPLENGPALCGDYTVSGLDCTQDDVYRCPTLMVSNWALFIAYHDHQQPVNITIYPGFSFQRDTTAEVTFSGLDVPTDLSIWMTMLSAEGDPSADPAQGALERLSIWDASRQESESLNGDCDPNDAVGAEIWDSRNTRFMFNAENGKAYCATVDDTYRYGLDIDNWNLDWGPDPKLTELFLPVNTTDMNLSFNFSADEVLTNLFVISVNPPYADFSIPGEDELRNCPCDPEAGIEVFCPGEPQYFQVAVENWGTITSEAVYLQVKYDTDIFDYVPGTTEIATQFDGSGNGLNWQRFLDGPDGGFPLAEPNLIANEMDTLQTPPLAISSFDDGLAATEDAPQNITSYLVRFQFLPKKGLPKNSIGTVGAIISDTGKSYFTNFNQPLSLSVGLCQQKCTEKELRERCGGLSPDQPQIFNPAGDESAGPDETPNELPDDIIDPRSVHPMTTQTPGCSLILL